MHLPIDDILPSFLSALREHSSIILRAPTGAGKTTRVPPAILDAGLLGSRQVVMLEPRRLAARAAARRMAAERGCNLGQEIGYHVRHDRLAGPQTKLLVVTEGILLRSLLSDPYLESAAVVVLDEFHERSIDADLVLGMVRLLQDTVRPDLKLVVMSATLDITLLHSYLNNCPVITSEGRLFPVTVEYRPRSPHERLAEATARNVLEAMTRTNGDVLAFLPGMAEIRSTAKVLNQSNQADWEIAILHGDVSPEQQDIALAQGPKRKVVLATNVAETSVTVEGITAVVDTGLARQLVYDPKIAMDRLNLVPISKSSADQRMGRAGRLRPGLCLRLWDANHHRVRKEQTEPEVRRVDLAGAVLQLISLGENELDRFPWLEPPRADSLTQAVELLTELGALSQGKLTSLGQQMVQLPLPPRLARFVVEGSRAGHADAAALVAALLSERDLFRRSEQQRGPIADSPSDILDRLEALREFERTQRLDFPAGTLARGAARGVLLAGRHLLKLIRSAGLTSDTKSTMRMEEAIGRALLAAFPDRVVRRRSPRSPRGVMVGGRGVRLDPMSAVQDAELFVAVEIDGGDPDALVRQASRVEPEWLRSSLVTSQIDLEFDMQSGRVVAWRRSRFLDLVLSEDSVALPKDERVAEVLRINASENFDQIRPADDSDAGRLIARLRFLRRWMPELDLPEIGEEQLKACLPSLVHGCRSFDELRRADWTAAVEQSLTHAQRSALHREAPTRITVPSGSHVTLLYDLDRPPVLAVRIQEIFGWRDTPRIAGGRVKVLLHLLGPNYRPQQITDDLASFWAHGYLEIRKELRRRYPKHAWPEEPASATAERRPQRR